jgi:putative Mn2+ efflux pump MntP
MWQLVSKYFVIIVFLLLTGCSLFGLGSHQVDSAAEFNKGLDLYKAHQGRKAMAVAIDTDTDSYAYGVGYGYPVQVQANTRALMQCNLSKAKFDVISNCKLVSDRDQGEHQFDKEVEKYMKFKVHKAMAIALGSDNYAYSFSYGYQLQKQANNEALKGCEQRKLQFKINELCQLYIIGNDIILDQN